MPRCSLSGHAHFLSVLEERGSVRHDLRARVEAFQNFYPARIQAAYLNAAPMPLVSRFIEYEYARLFVVGFEQRLNRYDLHLARSLRSQGNFRDQALHEVRGAGIDLHFNSE